MNYLSEKQINRFLWPYKDNSLYLQQIEIEKEQFKGIFFKTKTSYLRVTPKHLEATDSIICYNQLALAGFGETISKIKSKEYDPLINYSENILNYFNAHINELRFKKPIDTTKPFKGIIDIHKTRKYKEVLFIPTSFNLGENAIK